MKKQNFKQQFSFIKSMVNQKVKTSTKGMVNYITPLVANKIQETNNNIKIFFKEYFKRDPFEEAIKLLEKDYDNNIKREEIDKLVNYILDCRKRQRLSEYADPVQEDISSFRIVRKIPSESKKSKLSNWAKENVKKMENYTQDKETYQKILSNKSILNS